jgi:hypothetical protein
VLKMSQCHDDYRAGFETGTPPGASHRPDGPEVAAGAPCHDDYEGFGSSNAGEGHEAAAERPPAGRAEVPGGSSVSDRSVPVAVVLALLLGPLGLFYAAPWGAAALIVLAAAGVVPTFGFVLLFVWPASVVWAAVAASDRHKTYLRELAPEVALTA